MEFDPPVVVAPDGKTVATVTREFSGEVWAGQVVRLWDTQTGKERLALGRTLYAINALAFSADSKTLAVGAAHGTLRLWDVVTGKEKTGQGHSEPVRRVAFTPDGKRVISASSDGTCRLWDAATGAELHRFNQNDLVQDFALSPDGRTLVVGCGGTGNTPLESLFVWDVNSRQPRGKFRLATGVGGPFSYSAVHAVAFAHDGKTFAVAGFDKKVRIWDALALNELRQIPSEENVFRLCFSPDGQTIAGHGGPSAIIWWDPATGREVRRLAGEGSDAWPRSHFAFSPDGRLFAAADLQKVRVLETATGRTRLQLPLKSEVPFVAFSADSRWLATGGPSRSVTVWDLAAGQESFRLTGSERGVNAAAFSPDGGRLATASDDTTVLVWDLAGRLKTLTAGLPKAQRDGLWQALANSDPAKAQPAIALLVRSGDDGVSFLAERVKPIVWEPDKVAHVKRLVPDLNNDKFAVREAATRALRDYGELAEPVLREALKGAPTAEARRRVEGILTALETQPLGAGSLREIRAVEILERVGTVQSRRVLKELAGGAPTARLTRDAKAATDRLLKHPAAQ
jgi:WD40 repeat protein